MNSSARRRSAQLHRPRVAGNEDVDYYLVVGETGQRITAEVEAMRLGAAWWIVTSPSSTETLRAGACDDSALALQTRSPRPGAEDGAYVIAVRESSYAGRDDSRYCLHVARRHGPSALIPPVRPAGETIPVTFFAMFAATSHNRSNCPTRRSAI